MARTYELGDESVVVVGDLDGTLKRWFDARPQSVVLIRPDRIVGGASAAYAASDMVRGFDEAIAAPARKGDRLAVGERASGAAGADRPTPS